MLEGRASGSLSLKSYHNYEVTKMKLSLKKSSKPTHVVVHKNPLTSDESSYARVERHTVDIEHIVASLDERDTGVSKYTLLHCAYLIKDLVLENISQGNAVNVLDLGILYLKSSGSIRSENPGIADIPEISVAFTPSKEACDAAAKVKVSSTVNAVTCPVVSQIEDLSTHKTDRSVTAGQPLRITGHRLRIAGDVSKTGVYFAPQKDDGSYDNTEADWIRIEDEKFFCNKPSSLEFILPNTLKKGGKYTLILRTASGRGGGVNKTVRSLVYDNALTVA